MAYPAVGCIQCTVLLLAIRRCTFFHWNAPARTSLRACPGADLSHPDELRTRRNASLPSKGCPCASRRAVGCIQCTVLLRTIRRCTFFSRDSRMAYPAVGCIQCTVLLRTIRRCTFFSGTPWREPAFGPVRVPISRTRMSCGRAAARPYRQKAALARVEEP
jgi:hypothetical protein